ncbi:hypothetical protein CY34DRAFT_215478 [Suillus luteus UH-Slu-Lm8-n1]|uniref:Uncharacterized protein n=1 Tax=Suillus luteus UH-Slu-Lm8-n1 TaxID=930992 RepID=A0A0D0ATK2_9AGAM|nr:hypothetical protein CY34DRAFT_215478 [Suillus luteus UH-Slu-Lm8-n1]
MATSWTITRPEFEAARSSAIPQFHTTHSKVCVGTPDKRMRVSVQPFLWKLHMPLPSCAHDHCPSPLKFEVDKSGLEPETPRSQPMLSGCDNQLHHMPYMIAEGQNNGIQLDTGEISTAQDTAFHTIRLVYRWCVLISCLVCRGIVAMRKLGNVNPQGLHG